MGSDWMKFMPDPAASHEDRLRRTMHSAVQRILQKTGLGQAADSIKEVLDTPLLTFGGLMQVTNFPLLLFPVAYKIKQQQLFDKGLEMHPAKTPLFKDFERIRGDMDDDTVSFGIVFNWQGRGKFHVLHNDVPSCYTGSTQGRWWRIKKNTYVMEPLDALVGRFGPPELW